VLAASASDDRSNHDGTSRRTRGGAVTDTRDRALDVAAGAGNVAIPAALTGADVVASDLTQELLEAGERAAAARGAHLTWRTADAEALPFGDWEFDAVLSCVGVMFAPHHRAAADELVRVVRPGGTIAASREKADRWSGTTSS
jgi:ubiquinone/menaquinone biosynthesis C-methylase UbiE